jgi:hypothetical protein
MRRYPPMQIVVNGDMVYDSENLTEEQLHIQERLRFHAMVRRVAREIALLRHHRDVAYGLRAQLLHPNQELLRLGHFFFIAVWRWYLDSALVSLRAQTRKHRKEQVSLRELLDVSPGTDERFLARKADPHRCAELVERLEDRAKTAWAVVDQHIAHRDAQANFGQGVGFDETSELIDVLDEAMGEIWAWVFGDSEERLIVDADPYWASLLFSKAWAPPTKWHERLSAGSEALFVTESTRRDFTPTAVYARRPTDADLEEWGLSREEFEVVGR